MGVPGAFSTSTLLGVSLTLFALLTPLVPRWKAGELLRRFPGAPAPSGPGDGCPTCPELADDENVTLIQLLQGNFTGRVCLKNGWRLKPAGFFSRTVGACCLYPWVVAGIGGVIGLGCDSSLGVWLLWTEARATAQEQSTA